MAARARRRAPAGAREGRHARSRGRRPRRARCTRRRRVDGLDLVRRPLPLRPSAGPAPRRGLLPRLRLGAARGGARDPGSPAATGNGDIVGAGWPNTWPPPQPVTLTIDRSGSSLVLPVVEGPSPLRERPQLPESTEEQERAPDGNDSWHVTWRIEEDVLRRERRAFASSWGSSEAEGVGPRMDTSYGGEVGVSTTDPGNAWAIARATYELRWPQVEVQAEARQRFRSDARAYHLELELDVKENGELRWQRRWDRTFPRELQ